MNKGTRHTEETKAKMRGKKHVLSDAGLAALRAVHLGKVLSAETRRQMSESRMGHAVSSEARRKIGNAKRGVPLSEAHVAGLKRGWLQRKQSPEQLAMKARREAIVAGFNLGATYKELAVVFGCGGDNIGVICRQAGLKPRRLSPEEARARVLEGKKQYRKKYPERTAAQYANWYAKAENRQFVIDAARRWNLENRDRRNECVSASQARRRALVKSGEQDDRSIITAYFAFVRAAKTMRCYWCRKPASKADRQVDHIIPVSKGGATILANLCCACAACNRCKSAKLPEYFSGQAEFRF